MAQSSESSDSESPAPVQQLSIQWLDLKRVANRLKKIKNENDSESPIESDLLNAIRKIIKIHNDQNPDIERSRYIEDKGKGITEISNDPNTYSSIAYSCRRSCVPTIAKQLQEDPKDSSSSHHVIFYYKYSPRPHIIVTSSGNAWKLVRPYVDYSFPIKVSEKVVNHKKMIQIMRRPIFQLNKQEYLSDPGPYYLYPASNLYYIMENFKCEIKNHSDLYSLIKKEDKKRKKSDRCWIKVTTGGILRIGEKLRISDYPAIFDLFAQYMANAETKKADEEEESTELFKFLFFVQPARIPKHVLDESLLKCIYSHYIEKEGKGIPPNVHVRHKCLEDFLSCNTFRLQYYKSVDIESKPPKLEEIVHKIHAKWNNKIAGDEYKSFARRMRRAHLVFENQASEEVTADIMSYIEGEHQYGENTYFRIKNVWYELRQDYISLVHEDFKNLVKNTLIEKDTEWWLKLPYLEKPPSKTGKNKSNEKKPTDKNTESNKKKQTGNNDEVDAKKATENNKKSKKKKQTGGNDEAKENEEKKREKREEIFNRSYLYTDDKRFLVFDQIYPSLNKIEMCDILKYTDDAVYLYHVKEDFGQHTRDACSQILNAATMIKNSLLTFQSPTYLEEMWSAATKEHEEADHWRNTVKRRLESLGEKSFYDIFTRKIVFVYAYVPDENKSFSIALANINRKIDDKMIEKLKKSNYLDKHERLTSKFFYTNQKKFRIYGETVKTSIEIYNLLEARQFYNKSTLAKIELVQLAQNLQKLNYELKICEIESKGYGLKTMSLDSESDSESENEDSGSEERKQNSSHSEYEAEDPDSEPETSDTDLYSEPECPHGCGEEQ
ncbi:uncharacterized protein LOC135831232 [Planococcus citri]|uniref:uncharacterized protein LOC135831232 n=1 Tax=Planococcus citri TaxID=170843 RepID=UPI0031F9D359